MTSLSKWKIIVYSCPSQIRISQVWEIFIHAGFQGARLLPTLWLSSLTRCCQSHCRKRRETTETECQRLKCLNAEVTRIFSAQASLTRATHSAPHRCKGGLNKVPGKQPLPIINFTLWKESANLCLSHHYQVIRLLWRLNEKIHIKCLAQSLVHSIESINVNCSHHSYCQKVNFILCKH